MPPCSGSGRSTRTSGHVSSDHFKAAQQTLPQHLAETPRIVNAALDQDDWSELGELAVSDQA